MTIQSEFSVERKARAHAARLFLKGKRLREIRDSKRKKCYDWEFKNLRPIQSKMDRHQAKGFARLCAKVAIKMALRKGLIDDNTAAVMRSDFKAAFTKENLRFSNGGVGGCYFAVWGWTNVIIAHEVAHWVDIWIANIQARKDWQGHGATWRWWFCELLVDVAGFDRFFIESTMDACRLDRQAP